jgi:hypothetical protein
MKITLRKIKYSKFASQETNCFEAEVCLDGVPSIFARNEGRGGSTHLQELPGHKGTLRLLEMHAASLPLEVHHTLRDPHDPSKPFSWQPDAESVVDLLLEDHLLMQDMRRKLKRTTLFSHNGCISQFVKSPWIPATKDSLKASLARNHPGAVVLNELPEAEAFKLFKAQT